MDDFIAARSQMAMSLAFHIVFSCVGMVMPFMMAIAHYKYLKTKNEIYKGLTKAWSKGVAILFATGAVSGTMLSFELGLLFMPSGRNSIGRFIKNIVEQPSSPSSSSETSF